MMTDYAAIAANSDDALTLIDITDPATPTFVGSIQGAGAPNYLQGAYGVAVKGNYAFVSCFTEDSLTVIDISDPANPTYAASIRGAGAPNFLNGAREVFILGDYAYVACQAEDALTIIDISNPLAPTFKGSIQGAAAPNYLNGAYSVFVSGIYAYVACNTDDGLTIIDVSDPTAPAFVGSIRGSGAPNYLNAAQSVYVVGTYAYLTGNQDDSLVIIDVSNPAAPSLSGEIHGAGAPNYLDGAQNVVVNGNYAYVCSTVDDGLIVIDISNPAAPSFAASIRGSGAPNYLNSAFGVQLNGNYAYIAASQEDALTIIDISNPLAPTFKGSIQGAAAPNYLNGANNVALILAPTPPTPPSGEPSDAVLYPPGGSFNRATSGGAPGFVTYISPDGVEYPLHTPHQFGRWVMNFSGFGMPPIEYITERGPFQHGVTVRDYFLGPRVIQLLVRQGFCDRLAWWAGRAALMNEIRPNRQLTPTGVTPGELRFTETDGTMRSFNVFIQEGPRFEPRSSSAWDEWAFQEVLRFIAHDPVAFDPSQATATFTISLGSGLVFPITFPITFGSGEVDDTLAVNYLGTWLSFPVITIVGPIENPILDNQTTGEKIQLDTVVPVGRTITIDLTEGVKTVVDDLGNNLIGTVSTDSDLGTFHLAPDPEATGGVNTLRFRGTNPNGNTSVSVAYYDRYIGF